MKKKKVTILILVAIAGIGAAVFIAGKNGCLSTREPLATIETKIVEIDGLRTYYRVAGDSTKQPLVFPHGWGARRDDICGQGIDRVMTELSKEYRVVTPELPGLIRSSPPPTAWGMDEYAQFVHSFIERMEFSEPPILMGQSFGGGVATHYVLRYPKETPLLILVDASQGDRPKNAYYQLRFYWKSFYDRMTAQRWVPFGVKKAATAAWLGVPMDYLTRENIAAYRIMTDIETTYTVTADYASLAMPVLLLWGLHDTRVTPLARAREMDEEIPDSELVILKGGHLMLYTNTAAAADAIRSFINARQ